MPMTLRLNDHDAELLRVHAEKEGRSMHEVVVAAVRDRLANSDHVIARDQAITRSVERHREALKRLADL